MGREHKQGRCPCFFVLVLSFHAFLAGIAWLGFPDRALGEGVWAEIAPPTPNVLHSIEYISRVEAWGVGDDGTVVRYRDGSWRNSPSGSDENLLDITMVGEDEAWAVGENGTILHYMNGMWTPAPESKTLTLLPLHAVTFVNQDNGWVAGGDYARGGIALHYNGSTWVSATTTRDPLFDLSAVASDDVWFCGGNGRLMYFDGSEFSAEASPMGAGLAWRAMDFPFLSIGWVVGDNGQIARYTTVSPAGWHLHTQGSSLTTANLSGISVLPEDGQGYVVGAGGVRLRLENNGFTLEAVGGEDLNTVEMVNSLEGAALGGTTRARILHVRARTNESNLANVRMFPNPLNSAANGSLTFDRLPADVERVEIFNLQGDRVADFSNGVVYEPVTGVASWDGRVGGRAVAAGSYIFRIRTRSGAEKSGVLLVTKQ